jgi:hypothetical protein
VFQELTRLRMGGQDAIVRVRPKKVTSSSRSRRHPRLGFVGSFHQTRRRRQSFPSCPVAAAGRSQARQQTLPPTRKTRAPR